MKHFDDVGAYLLGALDEDERIAFEAELAHNETLRAEVEHLRVAADALPASAAQMVPPPELKDRIMAVVNSEAQLLAAAKPGPATAAAAKAPRRRARWFAGRLSLRPGLAMAMTLLVLVLGASGALVGESVFGDSERVTVAEVGDAQLIQRESGHSTLTASNLESPGDGNVYQVWLQREGEPPEPTNALFGPHSSGTVSVDVPGSLDGVEAVLVTVEPEGGSAKPTSRAVIVARPS
ncbi:MAG: anti-sigma factor [Solirubrobacteraceae bacterium]